MIYIAYQSSKRGREEEMAGGEERAALLSKNDGCEEGLGLARRVWEECRKLWRIVCPAAIGRLAIYGMAAISQAFAGHLGELELASLSIATTVVAAFNFGFMLGMASAMETLCGQAYGAKKYHSLGVYLQRSWIVLFLFALLLLPVYIFVPQILGFLGQPTDLARQAGQVSLCLIPLHFSLVLMFPLQRFLQCQLKNNVNAVTCVLAFVVHILVSWFFVHKLKLGLVAVALTLDFSWWVLVLSQFAYVVSGRCPQSWTGFSMEAFEDLWEFVKLSAASGVMLSLEYWYYRILVLLTGNLRNAKIAVDALAICMSINGWEMMIPMAFFAGTGVRVANELGAGNGKDAKFATIVSVVNSMVIGVFFWSLIMAFRGQVALFFSSSMVVIEAVDKLSILLAFTILLNSVQPILSGVAVGSGWQAAVAYVNIGTYYMIGIPLGILLGWVFKLEVLGIWAGMIVGTAVQTLILAYLTSRCDWEKEAIKASARMARWASSK